MLMVFAIVSPNGLAEKIIDDVKLSGYGSFTYQVSDDEVGYGAGKDVDGINDNGSFNGSKIAFNLLVPVSEKLEVKTQIIAVHEVDDFDLKIDWAFALLQFDSFDLRVGKIKYPVGMFNEFIDTGYAYNWITPPQVIYSELGRAGMGTGGPIIGPQATRESFIGVDLSRVDELGSVTLSQDYFLGQVDLEDMSIIELMGINISAKISNLIEINASYYQGNMALDDTTDAMFDAMNKQRHSAFLIGLKTRFGKWEVLAEAAKVEMDVVGIPAGMMVAMFDEMKESNSYYVTLSYQFSDVLLPYVSLEALKKGKDETRDEQTTTMIGLRWDYHEKAAMKFEIRNIETDVGNGLFSNKPDDNVNIAGVSLDYIF